MADNSGWMGDPNDIKGRMLFEQSRKGLNPEKAAKDAAGAKAAREKLARAKAAKDAAASKMKATMNKFTPAKPTKIPVNYKIPASPTH